MYKSFVELYEILMKWPQATDHITFTSKSDIYLFTWRIGIDANGLRWKEAIFAQVRLAER